MNLILNGSSVVFPLITFPLVSRALYSDMYGLCSWSFSVASWVSLIAMLGVNRYGIREVARNRDDAAALRRVTAEIATLTIITTLITLTCYLAAVFIVPNFAEHRELFLIGSLTVLCNTLGVGWFFQGIEQYSYITIRGVLIKAACLIGVVLLVHTPDDYLTYAALVVLASAITNLINFVYMIRIVQPRNEVNSEHVARIDWIGLLHFAKCSLRHLKPLLIFFSIAAAVSIYTTLDTVMLGLLSAAREVGYYTAAVNIKAALCGVTSALTGVLIPRASNMVAKGEIGEYAGLLRKCILIMLLFALPVCLVVSFFATPLISWYAGADFAGAGPTISIMAIAVVPISLSILCGDAILVPLGKESICNRIYCCAAILDFLLNLILIPSFGAIGTAIATLCVEMVVMLASATSAFRHLHRKTATGE